MDECEGSVEASDDVGSRVGSTRDVPSDNGEKNVVDAGMDAYTGSRSEGIGEAETARLTARP